MSKILVLYNLMERKKRLQTIVLGNRKIKEHRQSKCDLGFHFNTAQSTWYRVLGQQFWQLQHQLKCQGESVMFMPH